LGVPPPPLPSRVSTGRTQGFLSPKGRRSPSSPFVPLPALHRWMRALFEESKPASLFFFSFIPPQKGADPFLDPLASEVKSIGVILFFFPLAHPPVSVRVSFSLDPLPSNLAQLARTFSSFSSYIRCFFFFFFPSSPLPPGLRGNAAPHLASSTIPFEDARRGTKWMIFPLQQGILSLSLSRRE